MTDTNVLVYQVTSVFQYNMSSFVRSTTEDTVSFLDVLHLHRLLITNKNICKIRRLFVKNLF